jgi:hypothetical protein
LESTCGVSISSKAFSKSGFVDGMIDVIFLPNNL